MNWIDVDLAEMLNLELVVRAHATEDGMGTVIHTGSDQFTIPMQYSTFRSIVKHKKDVEVEKSQETNLKLSKLLAGQRTFVP